jgi:hypothetical protein
MSRATYRAEKAAEARARKVLDEHSNSERAAKTKGEQEAKVREWNTQIERARDDLEDFDEVCQYSQAVVTEPMSLAIMESEKGALIAYYLAKNPQEAERISKLSPSKQAAAIVTLEEKVARPAKQPSQAPEPITPVGTKTEIQKDPSKMSQAEFNAWRRKGGGKS